MRILVVDDEPDFVSLTVQWLTRHGHEAMGIAGASELTEWVVKRRSEVVLLDLILPYANGLSLISKLRSASPSTSIVVVTGLADAQLAAAAIKEGATDYLTKPVDFDVLKRVLDDIEQKRAEGGPPDHR